MKQLVVAVVVLIGVLLVVIWTVQRRLIYLPSPGPVPPAQEVLEGAREVTLQTSDGLELGAWFFTGPPRTNGSDGSRGERQRRG